MPHIHTEPGQHDFTASGFIFRTDGPEPRLPLHHHRKIGKWMQFGGHVELDESPWDAIRHELLEESGYELSQLHILQPKLRPPTDFTDSVATPVPLSITTHPFPIEPPHFHIDISFAFVTDEEPRQPVAERESSRFQLFTRAELAALPADATPENVRRQALFVFDELLTAWEAIPA